MTHEQCQQVKEKIIQIATDLVDRTEKKPDLNWSSTKLVEELERALKLAKAYRAYIEIATIDVDKLLA